MVRRSEVLEDEVVSRTFGFQTAWSLIGWIRLGGANNDMVKAGVMQAREKPPRSHRADFSRNSTLGARGMSRQVDLLRDDQSLSPHLLGHFQIMTLCAGCHNVKLRCGRFISIVRFSSLGHHDWLLVTGFG